MFRQFKHDNGLWKSEYIKDIDTAGEICSKITYSDGNSLVLYHSFCTSMSKPVTNYMSIENRKYLYVFDAESIESIDKHKFEELVKTKFISSKIDSFDLKEYSEIVNYLEFELIYSLDSLLHKKELISVKRRFEYVLDYSSISVEEFLKIYPQFSVKNKVN